MSAESKAKLSLSKLGVTRPDHVKDLLRNANEKKSIPVTINGVEYVSVAAAAKAHNVDNKTIYNRIKNPSEKFSGWEFSDKRKE